MGERPLGAVLSSGLPAAGLVNSAVIGVKNQTTHAHSRKLKLIIIIIKELESWVSDFQLPNAVWLAGFFNPQSFLTAIMQQMARKNEWPLDKMALQCDVTKKNKEDMGGPPREGAYVHGFVIY